jgi:hypothetical protein
MLGPPLEFLLYLDLQSAAPGMAWRFTTYRFSLENLVPGEYKLELAIDGTPAGTYPLFDRSLRGEAGDEPAPLG